MKKIQRNKDADKLIDKISNFVESIRMDLDEPGTSLGQKREYQRTTPQRAMEQHDQSFDDKDLRGDNSDHQSEQAAEEHAEKIVIDAEKMKANLVAPKGMLPIKIDQNLQFLRNIDNDDDFFHIHCHVNPSLRVRIEKGEYVDLDKLLPKDKSAGGYSMDDEIGIQLVTKNGQTYLTPPATEKKVNSLK